MGTDMKGAVLLLLVLVGLVCSSVAKPRGQQSRAPHLDHELTNRVLHADRSRHHEHPGQHHSAALLPPSTSTSSNSDHKRQHGRGAPDHSVHKKLLQEQEQEELLAGERLMHVRPRYTPALTATGGSKGSTNDTETVAQEPSNAKLQRKHPQPLSTKAQKLAKGPSQGNKAHGATKVGAAQADSSFTKEYKGHRAAKKYNPKKHSWKKAQHKDKLLRNRQNGNRDLLKKKKDGALTSRASTKKEKTVNKEMIKAKELLRKEKALKKKERREKRAKIMAYRKRE